MTDKNSEPADMEEVLQAEIARNRLRGWLANSPPQAMKEMQKKIAKTRDDKIADK